MCPPQVLFKKALDILKEKCELWKDIIDEKNQKDHKKVVKK